MKNKSLILAIAILMIACQPKKEELTEIGLNSAISDLTLAESLPACSPAPITTVKFVPPVIKDDAVEENTSSSQKGNPLTKNKKIIKDGYLSIKVKDVEASKKLIDAIVKSHHGYYENESFENDYANLSYNLKVRIPSIQFESFLAASEHADGEITSKNINARDVTEDYTDSETRLHSKQLFRERYNQLLLKALKVEDMMAIEENIRALQEEIESQEGHLKFIDDQVNYSTLNINLYFEKDITKPTVDNKTFLSRVKASLIHGWEMIVDFALWCMMQWPWAIVIITLIILIKVYRKRRKKNNS